MQNATVLYFGRNSGVGTFTESSGYFISQLGLALLHCALLTVDTAESGIVACSASCEQFGMFRYISMDSGYCAGGVSGDVKLVPYC